MSVDITASPMLASVVSRESRDVLGFFERVLPGHEGIAQFVVAGLDSRQHLIECVHQNAKLIARELLRADTVILCLAIPTRSACASCEIGVAMIARNFDERRKAIRLDASRIPRTMGPYRLLRSAISSRSKTSTRCPDPSIPGERWNA